MFISTSALGLSVLHFHVTGATLLFLAGFVLAVAGGHAATAGYLKPLWRDYFSQLEISAPPHENHARHLGYVERTIIWFSAMAGTASITAGWLTFRIVADLVQRRHQAVSPASLRRAAFSNGDPQWADPKPLLSNLLTRAPTNIYLVGVAMNLVVATAGGLISRASLWSIAHADMPLDSPSPMLRTAALAIGGWTAPVVTPNAPATPDRDQAPAP